MSTYRKLTSRRKIEHASQYTPGHAADKSENESRRAENWLIMPAPQHEKTHRDFSTVKLPDFVRDGDKLLPVSADDLVGHLERERKNAVYHASKSRNGVRGTSRRTGKHSLIELTATFSPPASDYLAVGVKTNPAKVAQFIVEIVRKLWAEIEAASGARVVAVTIHTDTDIPHINFILSRVTDDRLTVANGLGLVGPWCTAIDRQRRLGIFWRPHDSKFVAALRKHAARGRKGLPLDIQIARALDRECAAALPGLRHFEVAYAANLASRRADTLENKKQTLRAALASLDEVERLTVPSQIQILPSNEKGLTK